jgi:hypothetical protein
MQLVAVIPLLRFFIINISVCFLEKVKIDMLFKFYIFINVTHFFYRARKITTDILKPMLDFVHERRGTSNNVLLHPYFQDSSSFSVSYAASPATQLFLLHWRVGSLQLL